jgi:hypothetical protein
MGRGLTTQTTKHKERTEMNTTKQKETKMNTTTHKQSKEMKTTTRTTKIKSAMRTRLTEHFLHTATHVTGCRIWEDDSAVRFSACSYPLKADGQTNMSATERKEVANWLGTIGYKYESVAKPMYFGEGSFGSDGDCISDCVTKLGQSVWPAEACSDGA